MNVRQFFDHDTFTYTYLLWDPSSRKAVLIDPVLEQIDRDLQQVQDLNLDLHLILETHVHADHITSSGKIRERTGAKIGISDRAGVTCADLLLKDQETITVGSHAIRVLHTPGHTNGCVSYLCNDMVFTGDTLFVRGNGRTDFQEGSSEVLYQSIHHQLFSLPDETIVFPGHDYQGLSCSTIGEEKQLNPRIPLGTTVEAFSQIMSQLGLAAPKKIDIAVPANLKCGLK